MKGLLGILVFVLLSQGIGGLVHEFTDGRWRVWALVHRIHFLDGFEVYVCVGLVVLGIAVATLIDDSD
jgi:hypothetical protein